MDRLLLVTIIGSVIGGGALVGVFRTMKGGFGPFNLRAVAIVLVATMAFLLAMSGEQGGLTSAMGILGAIAGYVFGIKDKPNE